MSFRLKTILGIALIESALLLILIVSSLSFLHDSNERQLLERAETTANLFASATKDAVLATDLARLESFVSDILKHSEVVYVRIRGSNDLVLAEGGEQTYLTTVRHPDSSIDTVNDGVFDTQVFIEEAGIAFGKVELGLSTAAIHGVFEEAFAWATGIAITEVVLVAVFSFLLGTYLTKGLWMLKDASQQISIKGPGHQVDVQSNDEIGQVALAFNEMSRKLKNTYDELQQSLEDRAQTLIRSERNWTKNQAILASSLDAIITVDGEGLVIDYNPAAEQIFGWTAEEVKGTSMADFLIPEEFRKAHHSGMANYLKTGKGSVLNKRIQLEAMHKFGHRLPVEIAISDTSTLEGPLFTAFLRDLTQHIADQTELRLAATAFETIEPMFITDANAKIIRTNQAFSDVMGYSEGEVLGRTPALWSSGRHDQSFYDTMWNSLNEHGQWIGEIYNRRKNGELFPELLSISAVKDDSGSSTHYIAHLSDISEQKNREAALKIASQEAKQAEEAKGRFLAMMSHEIRTPLNSVIGMLEVLGETTLNHRQRELLQTGQESSWLLLSVINNILDFSKMEAGKFTLHDEVFNLHAAIQRSVDMFRNDADNKAIALKLDISEDVPQMVNGDDYRLRQVLVNLVSNAIKFTDQGSVRITAGAEHNDRNNWVLACQVQDTGIGLSDDQCELLFKEFSMVDQTLARHADGTGLGLVICKSLVEMMNGDISVTSKPGVGSCFSFSVQLKPTSIKELENAVADTVVSLQGGKILIAEDNLANQRVIEAMLDGTRVSIDLVADGLSALKAVQSDHYDLVLMDVSMPKMDGITATQAIRQLSGESAQVPIIAMTAHRLTGDQDRFIEAGMNDYLAKPMKKKDLLSIIDRWSRTSKVTPKPAEPVVSDSTPECIETRLLVDEQVLQQLVQDTSAEIVPELLEGYIDDSRNRMAQIIQARNAADGKQLEFETHTLGSSAAAHGNQALFSAAREIERLCRSEAYDDAFSKAKELEPLIEASLQSLAERIKQGFE